MTERTEQAPDASAVDGRRRADLARALAVAKWADLRFLDPVLGLVLPGLGDVLGVAAGLYIVAIAVRHGAPRSLVARMLVNLSVDCLGGVVPVVGDLFDFLNRANLRNARLLQQHFSDAPPRATAPFHPSRLAAPVALLAVAVTIGFVVAYLVVTGAAPGAGK